MTCGLISLWNIKPLRKSVKQSRRSNFNVNKILYMDHLSTKRGNPLPDFNLGGWAYSEPLGVRAVTMINYWHRGPKATFIFYALHAFFKRERAYLLKNAQKNWNQKR